MACINASVLFDYKFYKIMKRLDYNEDGFFQNEYSSRGERYDIYVDGCLIYEDVNEKEVDRLAEQEEKQGYNVKVVCK